jgi:hypothetical protein
MVATESIAIPSPPIHCIQDREKRNMGALSSTDAVTLRPVVVIDEMVSNQASIKLKPEDMIGHIITNEANKKTRAVMTIASLVWIRLGVGNLRSKNPRTRTPIETSRYRSVT